MTQWFVVSMVYGLGGQVVSWALKPYLYKNRNLHYRRPFSIEVYPLVVRFRSHTGTLSSYDTETLSLTDVKTLWVDGKKNILNFKFRLLGV